MSPTRFRPAVSAAMTFAIVLGCLAGTPAAQAKSKAPIGFQLLCLKAPSDCKGGGNDVANGGEETLSLLKRINTSVNNAIAPRSDVTVDRWEVGVGAGDCEDYVLAKRRALIKAGLPPSALRIAYVQTQSGEGHAVLVVKTTKGDFVLDNLDGRVRELDQLGYRIVAISGANPRQWS